MTRSEFAVLYDEVRPLGEKPSDPAEVWAAWCGFVAYRDATHVAALSADIGPLRGVKSSARAYLLALKEGVR